MVCFVCFAALWLHPPQAYDPTVCRCAEARVQDGWCGKCKVGYFANVPIHSSMFFEMLDLHGHEIDPQKTRCPTCRAALKTGGFCEDCRMGYIDGRGYFSHLCYAFAKGTKLDASTRDLEGRTVRRGWCKYHQRGRVANRIFTRYDEYLDAQKWFAILNDAVAKIDECETCAEAMIANGQCFRCGLWYMDGQIRLRLSTSVASETADDRERQASARWTLTRAPRGRSPEFQRYTEWDGEAP